MNRKLSNLTTPAAQLLVSSQLALVQSKQTKEFATYLRGKRAAAKFILAGCNREELRTAVRHWIQFFRVYPNYV